MTDYPCSRCDGKGRIEMYSGVLGGVCFACQGSGRQKTKPKKADKWHVFGYNRDTGHMSAKPLYNVRAKTEKGAIDRAYQTYAKASAAFKDTWTLDNAIALSHEEFRMLYPDLH